MIIEIILALLLGVAIGTLTGLTPCIHINLVSVMLLSYSAYLFNIFSPLSISVFIISMAITHTFIDFIPSIFLGAPDEDSFLSILPGHQLLLEGKGHQAVVYTLYGGLMALFIILLFTPIFILFLPLIYPYFQKIMGIVLILVSTLLILSEKKEKKLISLIIFLLAGFLGIATLNLNIKEPLLPLLTGLFGASTLIISMKQKTIIPEQKISSLKNIKLPNKMLAKGFFASIIASPFTAFLPGLGASQAAILGKLSLKINEQEEFLFLLGSINTIVMGLSFITFYVINKTRTGAAVYVSRLIPNITFNQLTIIILVIIISGLLSFIIAIKISKISALYIGKINYQKLSFLILTFLIIIVFTFSDFTIEGKILSLIIFITSTFLGIFTILKETKRIHLMGCLLIPTILFYLF